MSIFHNLGFGPAFSFLPFGMAAAVSMLVGCAVPAGGVDQTEESEEPETISSESAALVTPPAGSGGFTYLGDFTIQNGGLCIQPVTVSKVVLPRMGSCSNAAAKLSIYKQPDGNYNVCVRDSLKLGTYEDAYENDYFAYVGNCMTRTDKNSLQFLNGVTLSIKWESVYAPSIGAFIDKGNGGYGFFGSTRLMSHVPPNATLQSAGGSGGKPGTNQVWTLTKM